MSKAQLMSANKLHTAMQPGCNGGISLLEVRAVCSDCDWYFPIVV